MDYYKILREDEELFFYLFSEKNETEFNEFCNEIGLGQVEKDLLEQDLIDFCMNRKSEYERNQKGESIK